MQKPQKSRSRARLRAILAGVLAQRLVRRNCEHCRSEEQLTREVRDAFGVGEAEKFWRGKGCQECSGTGFRGRIAVYELLEMSPEMRKLVQARASHEQLESRAVDEGMVRLGTQLLALARAGVISLCGAYPRSPSDRVAFDQFNCFPRLSTARPG